MISIPNLKIKKVLEQFIAMIILDYEDKVANTLESESWLYRVFNGVEYGGFDFYEQAVNVIVGRGENSPKRLSVKIGWNFSKSSNPTIHIVAPAEVQGGENAIGMSEDTNKFYNNNDGTFVAQTLRSYDGDYELMINSDNEYEAELIYRFLQALFQSAYDTLQTTFSGTFSFSGKQVLFDPEVIPYNFIRVFSIKINNTIGVPKFTLTNYLTDVRFDALMVGEFTNG
jgi:hypothetical protein